MTGVCWASTATDMNAVIVGGGLSGLVAAWTILTNECAGLSRWGGGPASPPALCLPSRSPVVHAIRCIDAV